jgi:hypothetical protein
VDEDIRQFLTQNGEALCHGFRLGFKGRLGKSHADPAYGLEIAHTAPEGDDIPAVTGR